MRYLLKSEESTSYRLIYMIETGSKLDFLKVDDLSIILIC